MLKHHLRLGCQWVRILVELRGIFLAGDVLPFTAAYDLPDRVRRDLKVTSYPNIAVDVFSISTENQLYLLRC